MDRALFFKFQATSVTQMPQVISNPSSWIPRLVVLKEEKKMKDIFDDVAAFNTEAVIEVVGWWRQCTVQVFTFSTPLFLN